MEITAVAKDIGVPPRKLRLIANTVKGKNVEEALALLNLSVSPSAKAVAKVVKSASANAENNYHMISSELVVSNIIVDKGHVMKRGRPQGRGRMNPILKHSSHITAIVSDVSEED
jgi:large subunit ribosomal protein L22